MRIESISRDLRLGLRSMRRNPAFTAVVVLTLALGIGATTAIFSVVNEVLLEPLPFGDPDQLVMVWENDRATGTIREASSTADYYDFVDRSRSFTMMTMFGTGTVNWTRSNGNPRQLAVNSVLHIHDDVLGLDLQLGRGIVEADN